LFSPRVDWLTQLGFMGVVLALHTRTTLSQFGAGGLLPGVDSLGFFGEIGPLVAGLLVAGRVGARIGAELADMRASEQIDAIEVLSMDSFKLLVIPRIIACLVALPFLTIFMHVAGIAGGYVPEHVSSGISMQLYLSRAFQRVEFYPEFSDVGGLPNGAQVRVSGFEAGGQGY